MGAGHGSHAAAHGAGRERVQLPRSTSAVLVAVVVALAAVTAVLAALVWPTDVTAASAPAELPTQEQVRAEVRAVSVQSCAGISEDRQLDGTIPTEVRCGTATVRVLSGPQTGAEVSLDVDDVVLSQGLTVGSVVNVARLPQTLQTAGEPATWVFIDFNRTFPLQVLVLVFVVLVLALARLRGLAALAGLGLGYLAVLGFILPACRNGENPVLVALIGCTGVMIVLLYLSHGVSAKTTSALLGTVLGLVVTALLADWAVRAAHLSGLTGEDSLALYRLVGQNTLSGVILAGVILAGIGVLNDVTVTQASAIWELRLHAPQLRARELFAAGMRIGRDHLASTIYTIAFVYAGSALPTLLLITLYGQPLGQVLTSNEIAEEIVRTLVGGIGLVLAIPLTTAIAAVIAAQGDVVAQAPSGRRRSARH